MENFILIINEVVIPLIFALGGLGLFIFLAINLIKLCRKDIDNTIRLNISINDVPNDMGDTFKDIFTNAFATLIERRKNNDNI